MGDRGEVLVTWPGFELDGTAAKRLRAAGLRLRLEPKTGRRTSADVERLTRGAVAATISTDPFDRSVLAAADQLRVIARVGVGTDTIDLAAATEEGIVVTITPGANQETTADHAIAIMLAALRRIVEHDASVRRGEWERGAGLTPWDVHGVVVGIVGYGAIGRAVARRLEGFGAELLICDPAVERIDGAHVVAPPELLERADIVSLARPADGWNTCVDRPRGAGSDTAPGPVGEHVAPLAVALRAAARETHVRVAGPHSDALAPALDADVVLPQASDPRTVEAFALRLRYPPEGRRGYGPRRAGRHTERPARPALTAQIESPAIAAHVDTLVAGTADLAMTMAEHAVSGAVADVERAAREAGTRFGLAGGDPAALLALCAQPPDVLMCAIDIRLAARAADEAAAAARSGGALVRD